VSEHDINLALDWREAIRWTADGLVPVITQDVNSGRVLMFAWMNRQALELTAQRGEAIYWSRSRNRLWHKGETSGNIQKVREIRLDCDGDVILLQVEQVGGIACHTGRESCFYFRLEDKKRLEDKQWVPVDPVLKDPDSIYS